mgnify:FL=1|jgi:hypothetical protein
MPTNEVRRDAARRLREIGKEIGEGALLWYHISKALGVDLTIGGESAANVLADLIEPEPERTCHFEPDVTEIKYDENDNEIETGEPAEDCSAFECSECGYPMLYDPDIGWFDYCEPYKPHFKYCPNCGAKVVCDG